MPQAFQRDVYDGSRGEARMADLVTQRGQVEATNELRKGQATGQMFTTLGEIAIGTMNDIVRYKQAEPRRRREEAQFAKIDREEKRASNLQGVMQIAGNMPPEEGIELLRKEGYQKEAGELSKQVNDTRRQAIADQKLQIEVGDARLGQALNILASVELLPVEERQAAYTAKVEKVRGLVGEDLGAMVPNEYSPDFAAGAQQWGMKASEKLKMRNEALEKLEGTPKDKRESDEYFTKAVGTWLQTVDNQEEWDSAIKNASALGASKETLAKFGATFSPEAVQTARGLSQRDRQPAAAGSLEDYITTLQTEKGRPLTAAEMNQGRDDYMKRAGTGSDGGLTASQKNTVIRWKAAEMRLLEKDKPLLSDEEYQERKARIEDDADDQLGVAPKPRPPVFTASEGRSAPMTPAASASAIAGTMGDITTPGASAPPARPPMAGPTAGRPAAPPMGAAPAAAAPPPPRPTAARPMPQVGEVRRLKNGQSVRITKIHPDGSMDFEPVQ